MERHPGHVVFRGGEDRAGRRCRRCRRPHQTGGGAGTQLSARDRAPASVGPAPARAGGGSAGYRQRRLERVDPAGAADAERAARPRHRHGGVQRPAAAGDRHPDRQPHAVRARHYLRRARRPAGPPLNGCARRHHRQRQPVAPAAQPRSAPRHGRFREPADHHRLRGVGAPGRHRPGRAPSTGGSAVHAGGRQAGHRPVRAPRHGNGLAAGGRQPQQLSRGQAADAAGGRGAERLPRSLGVHPRGAGAGHQQRPGRPGAGDPRAGGVPARHASVLGDGGHSRHVHGGAVGILLAGRHDQRHQPDRLRDGARHRRRRRHRGRRGVANPVRCRQVAGGGGQWRRDAHAGAGGGVFAHHAVRLLAFADGRRCGTAGDRPWSCWWSSPLR